MGTHSTIRFITVMFLELTTEETVFFFDIISGQTYYFFRQKNQRT
ncbi:hypothetical protein BACSTE_02720 [Bacteroides stercoris ATCC 43183]|uniref:Uncharacterized protein n=1 Tax=Bacteroides stercoris ATCC 43183 TaxID=449673 RepID=B0NTA4_BACSE|nr:hypothetical protein BACSTE_02720 [Bacteroides stercoris ATCC 43183]